MSTVETRPERRQLVASMVRPVAIIAILVALYATVPLSSGAVGLTVIVTAAVGLLVFGAVFVHQVRRIRRSPTPMLAAVEALVLVYGTFLVQFAMVYVAMATSDPDAFSEPLNRIGGLYLSITVLSTVGFGDITPDSDLARIVVSAQMLADIVLIATAFRMLSATARKASERS